MTEKLETPTLAEVVDAFHTLFPPQLAAGWDASGLVAGRGAAKVSTVLFAVDALTATAEEAVAEGAQLLITHHPLLLRGAKFIPTATTRAMYCTPLSKADAACSARTPTPMPPLKA